MFGHAEKTNGDKSSLTMPSKSRAKNGAGTAYVFADNRVETVVQRKLQEMVNNSIRLKPSAPKSDVVVQLKGKYKQFKITNRQELLAWIDGDDGWDQEDLIAVIRDWNAENADKIAFGDLAGTNADGFIEPDDVAFQQETKKEEEPVDLPDSPVAARRILQKPKNYQVVREGWNDEKAMKNHCYTYCGPDRLILVQAAQKLGLEPPMLGHGSDSGVGGTAKDAGLWKQFQEYMEWYFADHGYEGRTTNSIAKDILKQ